MKKYVLGSMALVVVLLVTAYLYIKGHPRYSLYQFRSAIEDHDGEKALKYLDIDAIVDNLMRDLMSEENSSQPENEWEAAGRNIGNAMAMAMMPGMKETLKSQFKSSIASAKKSKLDDIKKSNLWDLQIKTDGKMAIVSSKTDPSTQFRMIKATEGHWKIVEIINTREETRAKSHEGAGYRNAAKTQIEMLGQALDSYRLDTGHYPTTSQGLNALEENPGDQGWDGPYLKKARPNDPWGMPYQYQSPGAHGNYDLFSYGADGVPGGEGVNQDVASWE